MTFFYERLRLEESIFSLNETFEYARRSYND